MISIRARCGPFSVVLLVALATAVAACGRRQATVAPPPAPGAAAPAPLAPSPPPPPPVSSPSPTAPVGLSDEEAFARKTLAELNAEQPLVPVYFAFNRAELDPAAQTVLANNAQWLLRWPTTRATVEGHCDDRGTSEYNLALGQRRATAARDYLVTLGVQAARLVTVSYGEEQPSCSDGHEGCWSRNRRAAFAITEK